METRRRVEIFRTSQVDVEPNCIRLEMAKQAKDEERRAEKEESRDTQYAEISRQSNYPGGVTLFATGIPFHIVIPFGGSRK